MNLGARSLHQLARHFSTNSPGFIGIRQLQQAEDWSALATDAVAKCDALVDQVITSPPSLATVRLLDDISDTICQVLDAAEFCRNVHSEPKWRGAAENVCIQLGGYVQQLNTHYGLYTALVKALPDEGKHPYNISQQPSRPSAVAPVYNTVLPSHNDENNRNNSNKAEDEETLLVGRMLVRDFERYGVHLDGIKQDRMSELMHKTQVLSMNIVHNTTDPAKCGSLTFSAGSHEAMAVGNLPVYLQKAFKPLTNSNAAAGKIIGLSAPAESSLLTSLQRTSDNANIRKAAYMAYHQQPASNLGLIDELVQGRHEIAQLMGYRSYAEYQLDGFSLAHRPQAVDTFLKTLSSRLRPTCDAQIDDAVSLIKAHDRHNVVGVVEYIDGKVVAPWERIRLIALGRSSLSSQIRQISPYLSVTSCIAGLSSLLKEIMSIELREEVLSDGSVEGWAPGVRKLTAVHKDEGELGVVYLDLYKRRNKFPGAAHFVLRCGREKKSSGRHDSLSTNSNNYQLPVVALVANFPGGGFGDSSSQQHEQSISHSEAETLCHEFGHALNSLLSRTKMQHLSGTRGPLDVVEIPSHVFERYAWHPSVLRMLCSSQNNKNSISPDVLRSISGQSTDYSALALQDQIAMSLFDQALHGENPPTGNQVEKVVKEIWQQHSSFGYASGTYPHLRFAHIVAYGATYYSYLYAHCIASEFWQRRLDSDPLGVESGEVIRRALMQPGGAKESGHYVQDLFASDKKSNDEGPILVEVEDGGRYPVLDGFLQHLKIDT